MSADNVPVRRSPSLGEEIANSTSHGIGLLAALVATPFLVAEAVRDGDVQTVVSVGLFAATLILLYLSSTMYHALPPGKAKRAFEILDNAAVFLLIAGTYTPLTIGFLRGVLGWSLFLVVWALAAAGVLLLTISRLRFPGSSACLCVAMGWLFLFALRPVSLRMPRECVLLIVVGGVAYTGGLAFWAARRLPYGHLVWHLFVLVGTTCHFIAIFRCAT